MKELVNHISLYYLITVPSFFLVVGVMCVCGGLNARMLTLQDENQSKKGLGEIYAVSISCLVYLVHPCFVALFNTCASISNGYHRKKITALIDHLQQPLLFWRRFVL